MVNKQSNSCRGSSRNKNKQHNFYKPLVVAIAMALSSASQAATFTVTNTNDSGSGSLRQAVIDANTAAGADEVVFSPSLTGQTITLTGSELNNTGNLTIKGPIAGNPTGIIISGGGNSRVLSSNANLLLDNVTLTGGVAPSGGAIFISQGSLVLNDSLITGNNSSLNGGGISTSGFGINGVTLNRTIISNNRSSQGGGGISISSLHDVNVILNQSTVSNNQSLEFSDGGGIFLYSYFGANLTLNESTISNNSTNQGRGGGVFVESYDSAANVVVNQSTISGNTAKDSFIGSPGGGGISVFGHYTSLVTLNQSTVYNNSVTGYNSKAGGIYVSGGNFQEKRIVTLVNSIVSGNSGEGGNIYVRPSDESGNGIFATNSLFGDSVTKLAGNISNIFSNSPGLGILKNNGGLTETHLLNSNSPAINKGSNALAPDAFDQRGAGFLRIQNGTVDIGSVERQDDKLAEPIPTLGLISILSLISIFTGFFGWRDRINKPI